jgi:putative pyruvate formate lyase activating enzyme
MRRSWVRFPVLAFVRSLRHWLRSCEVCPNRCRVDRTAGETGRCRIDDGLLVSSAAPHFGEERCLVGRGGSGTVFLAGCNLSCVFCQNYEISQLDCGSRLSKGEVVRMVLDLQARGVENINLVSPTHQGPQLFEALAEARSRGLRVPVVYNCGGYENPEFLRELDGMVDIYMPDFKYGSEDEAERYSGVRDYCHWCMASLREMHRQVGDLVLSQGVAQRGLLVRHLVLPGGIAGSRTVVDFLVDELSPATYLNVMDQYRPAWHAAEHPTLRRRTYRNEIEEVVDYACGRGMTRVLS